MSKPASLSHAAALEALHEVETLLQRESAAYASAYAECVGTLHRLYSVMARERATVVSARRHRDALRAVIDKGEGRVAPVVEHRENPMITQGLLDAVAAGEVETEHKSMLPVSVSLTILVGGLARMGWRTHAHVLAASRFCNLFERSQMGGARAIDYTQVRVDTSGPRQDQVAAGQDAARREYEDACRALGDYAKVVREVVIYGVSGRGLAKSMGLGSSGRARRRAEGVLRIALDELAKHFGYSEQGAKARTAWTWADGSKPKIIRDEHGNILGGPLLAPVDQGAEAP
jgi:hypothetical protein